MKTITTLLLVVLISAVSYSQNVGIGTPTPQSNLHVAGSMHMEDFAYYISIPGQPLPNEEIWVNKDGELIPSGRRTLFLSIGASEFTSQIADFNANGNRAFINSTTAGGIFAPVALPSRVFIKSIRVVFVDNSTQDIRCRLFTTNPSTLLATVTSNGIANIPVAFTEPVNISPNTGDLYVRVDPDVGGNWDNGNIKIRQVVIEYLY